MIILKFLIFFSGQSVPTITHHLQVSSSCLNSNGSLRPPDLSSNESETSLYTMPFQSPFAVNSSAFLYNNWFGSTDHKASSQLFGLQGKTLCFYLASFHLFVFGIFVEALGCSCFWNVQSVILKLRIIGSHCEPKKK